MGNVDLRNHLRRLLGWKDAHAGFDAAVEEMPVDLRGQRPEGFAHSAWELLEHLRIAQRDILEFCRDAGYEERSWPRDYWPEAAAPPTDQAWEESIRAFREDRTSLQELASDESLDLLAAIPHGTGQTYLRELLLVADHNAYHIGQLVMLRQLLGAWPTR